MPEKEQQIFLVRHLATSGNISGVYMGRKDDLPIADTQAESFREKIKTLQSDISPDDVTLFSSPALRCIQTLEIVKQELNLQNSPVKTDERFLETDLGDFAGLNMQQIKEKFPEHYNTWINDAGNMRFPNGESYIEVQKRAIEALRESLNESESKNLIICTHVDVMKMILFDTMGIPIANKKLMVIPNGSVCTLITHRDYLKFTGLNIRT